MAGCNRVAWLRREALFASGKLRLIALTAGAALLWLPAVGQAPAVTQPAPVRSQPESVSPTQTGVGAQAPGATPQAEAASDTKKQQQKAAGQEAPQAETPGSRSATDTGQLSGARPALGTSIWSQRGVMVKAIRFDGVTFSQQDGLTAGLAQKAGAPLDPDKVRADLRRLFASGRYRDISVRGERSGEELTLVYAGIPRYYIGRVQIDGVRSQRLNSMLEFATKLDPGTAYTEAQVPAAVEGVKQSLAQNGFYQPVVKATTTKDDAGDQMNFIFKVDTGLQAHVGNVVVQGKDPGYDADDFRANAKLNCGWLAHTFNRHCSPRVTRDTTSTALNSLRGRYQKRQRLEATVSVQNQTYSTQRKQLDYDFAADQGPVVKVVVVGAKISKTRLHLLVPVFQEGTVDNDLLNEGAHNIRDFLQQQGFFDATTQVELIGQGTGDVTVQYTVNKGNKHKVVAVDVKGNKYFDADTLIERLSVKKADLYQRAGRYSQALLTADTNTLLGLYKANGFSNAKVTTSVKDSEDLAGGKGKGVAQISVAFNIEEGTQQKFGKVRLSGVDDARMAAVKELVQTQEDQPFSLLTLTDDRDAVLSYYLSHGFDQAKIEIKQDPETEDSHVTDIDMVVDEGHQVFVDQVLLSGIEKTRPKVVLKELEMHAGEPLDQSALLATQRNLYNLALFSEVNAAVQNPTGDALRKNVLVQLYEAKRWDVTYGFGFEVQTGTPAVGPGLTRGTTAAQNGHAGFSPRGAADISRINFRGTDQSLTLHVTYGLLERVATLTFNNPHLLGHPSLNASVSGGYSNVQNITTFQASTLQGDFRVAQKYKKADTLIYDFLYRRVSVNSSSLEISPNLITQLSQPVTVGGPSFNYIHDTRDPSPLDAGRGHYYSVSDFVSDSAFGAQTNFNKLDLSHSSYYTFGKRKYVFARNTRIGFENDFGGSSTSNTLGIVNCSGNLFITNATCNPIPLPERMYAGGTTSHRGFGINQAGPRDLTTGYPVGGSAVVVNTFELRLPPPTLPIVGNSVSFVVFHDMGNVFRYPTDMFKSIKNFHQPNESSCRTLNLPQVPPGQDPQSFYSTLTGVCDFNYYSHAVGVGARYKTPVGPIRVDFSYNLNPPWYPVYYDYTKNLPHIGQANHFNFFFSIGQSF